MGSVYYFCWLNSNTRTMSGLPVLLFLDISGGELLVIMLVEFLVFGPDKMPEMARKAGRFMNQLKKASNDLTREFKKETAVFENEINTVQKKITDQVESVSREVIQTKKKVMNDLSIEDEPFNKPAEAVTSEAVSDESEAVAGAAMTENSAPAAKE